MLPPDSELLPELSIRLLPKLSERLLSELSERYLPELSGRLLSELVVVIIGRLEFGKFMAFRLLLQNGLHPFEIVENRLYVREDGAPLTLEFLLESRNWQLYYFIGKLFQALCYLK